MVVSFLRPQKGAEESLGHVSNAFPAAYDFKQQGDDVRILF
jgi:hypothetical protein